MRKVPASWSQSTDTGRLLQAPRGLNVGLLQVPADEFRHLEHRHLFLAAEDRLESVVSVDHASVLAVLQLLALDVGPELLRHLVRGMALLPITAPRAALGVI